MVACAMCFILFSAIFNASDRHATAIRLWSEQMSRLSLILAEQTSQSLHAVEVVLNVLAEDVQERLQTGLVKESPALIASLTEYALAQRIKGNPLIKVVAVSFVDGQTVSSSSLSSVAFAKDFQQNKSLAIASQESEVTYLGRPVFDEHFGKWLIYVVREVKDAQGNPVAWLCAGLSVSFFSELYEKISQNLGSDASVSLYRGDYELVTRFPKMDALIGQRNLTSGTYQLLGEQQRDAGVLVTNGERLTESSLPQTSMFAARRLEKYPFIVTVVIARDIFLKEWDDVVHMILLRSFLAIILLGIGARWLLTSDRRLRLELFERKAAQEALSRAHEELEAKVFERTRELDREVQSRKKIEEQLRTANERTAASSHRAGMAEVANSVLHNIGNVLNSANVSILLLYEQHRGTGVKDLPEVVSLLMTRQKDLALYLTEDARGQHLPRVLALLAEVWQLEHLKAVKELERLILSMQHIKEIVSQQQSLSGQGGVSSTVNLAVVLNESLLLLAEQMATAGIEVVFRPEGVILWFGDRIKLTQIILNVLLNAHQALVADDHHTDRKLIVSLSRASETSIEIDFCDNGIGMSSETLMHLFSYGFTTKEKGHGFGLHASALAAQQMGGRLTARSEGLSLGATFTLNLFNVQSAAHVDLAGDS